MSAGWWEELGQHAETMGHARHSAGWYRAIADEYLVRFPAADERSKDSVRRIAEWAERREATA